MQVLSRDGVRLVLHERGDARGEPVLFLHGITSSVRHAWLDSGVAGAVGERGRPLRLLLLDQRGHGESDLPADPGAYSWDLLIDDALAALDRAGGAAHLVGYSMGAEVALRLALCHPGRVRSLLLGGYGRGPHDAASLEWARRHIAGRAERFREADPGFVAERVTLSPAARAALLADPGWPALAGRLARAWVAASLGLAATYTMIPEADYRRVAVRCRVVVAERDHLFGPDLSRASGRALAALLPNADYVEIPGEEHATAFRDPRFHGAVASFLG